MNGSEKCDKTDASEHFSSSDLRDAAESMRGYKDLCDGENAVNEEYFAVRLEKAANEIDRLRAALNYIVRRGYTGAEHVARRVLRGEGLPDV